MSHFNLDTKISRKQYIFEKNASNKSCKVWRGPSDASTWNYSTKNFSQCRRRGRYSLVAINWLSKVIPSQRRISPGVITEGYYQWYVIVKESSWLTVAAARSSSSWKSAPVVEGENVSEAFFPVNLKHGSTIVCIYEICTRDTFCLHS